MSQTSKLSQLVTSHSYFCETLTIIKSLVYIYMVKNQIELRESLNKNFTLEKNVDDFGFLLCGGGEECIHVTKLM